MNVKERIKKSSSDFERIVWPDIQRRGLIPKGKFLVIEGHSSKELRDDLDKKAGIDSMVVLKDGIISLSTRITYGTFPNFTVRRSVVSGFLTEIDKRIKSLECKYIISDYTIQACIVDGELLGYAITDTKDITRYILSGKEGVDFEVVKNSEDGNTFFRIWWTKYRGAGYRIITVGLDKIRERMPERARKVTSW